LDDVIHRFEKEEVSSCFVRSHYMSSKNGFITGYTPVLEHASKARSQSSGIV